MSDADQRTPLDDIRLTQHLPKEDPATPAKTGFRGTGFNVCLQDSTDDSPESRYKKKAGNRHQPEDNDFESDCGLHQAKLPRKHLILVN